MLHKGKKTKNPRTAEWLAIQEKGCPSIASHFFDSGSFTLWTQAEKYAAENKTGKWSFYNTPEFWAYVDAYAAFVKKFAVAIDLYANVDVIPNPKLSLRNLRYLEEKHGLNPVPVVHYTTDPKWLEFYIAEGYEVIALGGLVGSAGKPACQTWIDRCFDIVCDTPDRKPRVKIHGFGVTVYSLILRYPWYSVDSTTWSQIAAFGGIMVPHKRKGKFVYDIPPYVLKVSVDSPTAADRDHILNASAAVKAIAQEWLDLVGVPLGKSSKEGEVLEWGVVNSGIERRMANLKFFESLRASLPEWPWPFNPTEQRLKGFQIGRKK